MNKRIYIKPSRPGLVVVDPATNIPLPDEGARVVPNQYWNRRLADGDVVRATKSTARKSTTTKRADAKKSDEAEG